MLPWKTRRVVVCLGSCFLDGVVVVGARDPYTNTDCTCVIGRALAMLFVLFSCVHVASPASCVLARCAHEDDEDSVVC